MKGDDLVKTIGLLGGMSCVSSLEYYKRINKETKIRLGDTHCAKSIMYTFDFHEIQVMQHTYKWDQLENMMVDTSKKLKEAGADFIVICTNTMHLMAESIEEQADIDVLHIAHVTGREINKRGLNKVGLLGTKFTMESSIYQKILKDTYDIDTIIPNEEDMSIVHDIIYRELSLGKTEPESRAKYLEIINRLKESGAQGIILGCTEIPILIKQEHTDIPIFNTTAIHAKAAVEYALGQR